jgi:rhamnogalacturonyl hydrolase YesR
MKKLLVVIMLLVNSIAGFSQEVDNDVAQLKRIADGFIENNVRCFIDNETGETFNSVKGLKPGRDLRINSPHSQFVYTVGVTNIAMIELGKLLNEKKYTDYAIKNIEFLYDNAAYFKESLTKDNHWNHPFSRLYVINYLDDCGAMAAGLADVYQIKKREVYLEYLNKATDFISNEQFRLEDGTLVRDDPVKYSLWADDLYMSVPLLARMGVITGNPRYFDDAIRQVINFDKYLWDEQIRLYFHGWLSDEKEPTVAHWGRANGWVMAAKIELLKLLPKDHPQREEILKLLKKQIRGVARYQSQSGLWHNLLDKTDSFEEVSATAMFTYGIAYAVNEGILPKRYISVAKMGWKAIVDNTNQDYQSKAIRNICIGTGIRANMNYYYTRPVRSNDTGVGAVISAGVEIVRFNKNNPHFYTEVD